MARKHPSPEPDVRRWHFPPPLPESGATLEGMGILEEVPGELGILIWQSLRTVTLWAAAPVQQRSRLFLPGAEEPRLAALRAVAPEAALDASLTSIATLLSTAADVSPEHVGTACVQIAQWAQERGNRATALDFTRAAALASPDDPKRAIAIARMARDRAEYPTAEAWYQRTIGLARQADDWDTYARAYIGLGKTAVARGAFPVARKHFLKARRAADRKNLNEVLGMALHDLFALEAESHRDAEAIQYAQAALRTYRPGDVHLPFLAYDAAFFWVDRGHFWRALPVLRALVPHLDPEYKLQPHGGLARAAGAMGDEESFEDAWRVVWAADDQAPNKADALVEASRGAISLARWTDAERAATHALTIARERRQNRVAFDAESVLETIRSERSAHAARQTGPAPDTSPAEMEAADVLAHDLVEQLEATTGAS